MARTGQEILDAFFTNAIDEGLITAVFEQGRLGILFAVAAKQMVTWEEIIEGYENEFNLVTAKNEQSIEYLASPLYRRRFATPSQVMLRFTRAPNSDPDADYIIPINTLVETAEYNPITYYTIEEKTLWAGQEYVTIKAYSHEYGAATMVEANQLTVVKPISLGLDVTNLESSWNGQDIEPIEDVRKGAFNARLQFETDNKYALDKIIRDTTGLKTYEFQLFEDSERPGRFSVYIDSDNEYLIKDVEEIISYNKAFGVYFTCEKAIPVNLDFEFKIEISSTKDLTPDIRRRLKIDVEEAFKNFVETNGIGNTLVLSRGVHRIYEEILSDYDISDIHLEVLNMANKLDEKGNVDIALNEVIKVQTISFNISAG